MSRSRRTSAELQALRERVRLLAAAQGGVFRRSDLAAWGLEPTAVLTMRRNGAWVRLHHGVYADRETVASATTPITRHLLLAAAAIAAIPGPIACFGTTASLLQGVPVDRGHIGPVELVRPLGRDSRALSRRITGKDHLPGARIRILDLDEDELIAHEGLPTVDPRLAAWSAALTSEVDWGVAAMDAVAWQSPEALEAMAEHQARWGHLSGAGGAAEALRLARTGAQSPLESLSRVRLVRLGLPEPKLQVPLYDDQGLIGIVDMLFEEFGVVGEADGAMKYANREDLIEEKGREDRIRASGYPVSRWGWQDAMRGMARVASEIRRASAYSRRRSA